LEKLTNEGIGKNLLRKCGLLGERVNLAKTIYGIWGRKIRVENTLLNIVKVSVHLLPDENDLHHIVRT